MLSLGLRGGKPRCCPQLRLCLAGSPRTAVKERGRFSARLSWSARSDTGDATTTGADLHLTRAERQCFSSGTPLLSAHLDQKHSAPFQPSGSPSLGGHKAVPPGSSARLAPAPARAPSLPLLPCQVRLGFPSLPHLRCTAPATPARSRPAALPTPLDPRPSLSQPTRSLPTPLDRCYRALPTPLDPRDRPPATRWTPARPQCPAPGCYHRRRSAALPACARPAPPPIGPRPAAQQPTPSSSVAWL